MAAKQNTRKKATPQKKSNNKKEEQNISMEKSVVQDEIILVIAMVISVILFLSNFNLSGKVGIYISSIAFGMTGVVAYVLPFLVFFATAFSLSNVGNCQAMKKMLGIIIFLMALSAFVQLSTTPYIADMELADYYENSSMYHKGGGMIGGFQVKLLCGLFDTVVTYIIIISIMLISVIIVSGKTIFMCIARKSRKSMVERREMQRLRMEQQQALEEEYMKNNDGRRPPKTFTINVENGGQELGKKEKKPAQEQKDEKTAVINLKDRRSKKEKAAEAKAAMKKAEEENSAKENAVLNVVNMDNMDKLFQKNQEKKAADFPIKGLQETEDIAVPTSYEEELRTKFGNIGETTPVETVIAGKTNNDTAVVQQDSVKEKEEIITKNQKKLDSMESSLLADGSGNVDQIEIPQNTQQKVYAFPPVNLLSAPKPKANKGMTESSLKETAIKLQQTLESFGVRVSILNVSCGPAVTRYELQPEQGVKVSRITSLADDIKLNLAAADIRIEAPIPGKAAVGIEVPNKENSMVSFRELLESKDFKEHPSDIAFAVGKDIGGQTIVTDIAKMPHLLIAGATGSGKSVCINTLVMSIIYKANPADVRLIMVDPKVVELSVYNGIPHLLIPVVTDPKKASAALNWAVVEMTQRYKKFAETGVRDLKGYNEKVASVAHLNDENFQKMPQIVIIIDELADLMMVAPGEVEDAICRLAQMARAAGLHLIIATQRPSVNVITGLIKANVPSRIAFAVSSAIDSRTILDGSGAEKLLGKGDMLFFPSGYPKPVRIQGAFISDKEVSAVVDFLKENNSEAVYSDEIKEQITNAKIGDGSSSGGQDSRDDYFMEAGKFIIDKDKASIGMLQRVYKIGFNRAARIMDQLAEAGVVGPEEGTKPRKILMTLEEFEQYLEEY